MRLHFREYGRGAPLIVLHGLFGSLDNWVTISRRLGERYHVFAVDQRNHGRSPHSPEMNYPLMAGDLFEFMQDHSLASAHVLGHSMGGKTAMQFALLHPDKVDKLLVVDIAPRAYEPAHGHIFHALLALDLRSIHSRRQGEEALAPAIPDLVIRRFLLKNLARDHDGTFHWKLNLPGIQRNYPALTAAVEAQCPYAKPALFICGGRSDYLLAEDLPAIRRLFPAAEIGPIPDAGHRVHVEAPDVFLQTAQEFLTR